MTLGEPSVVWSLPAEDARAGWHALWWTFGPAGELAVLLVRERYTEYSDSVRGWVGAGVRPPFDAELVVVSAGGEPLRRVPVDDIQVRPGHLALLPEARFLLVSGRTVRRRDGTWRDNAVVYSADGRPGRSFCVGDDIPALTTTPDGNIWTAYGDEGIFGSHPESRGALAGWGPDGRALWSPRQPFPEGPVNGSTAATDGAYVWTAWHCRSGTYLTRITPATGETRSWPTPLRRVDGLAVRGDRAVLTSREHDRPWTEVVRIELRDNGTCAVTGRDRQRLPGHVVMHCGQGRDGTLLLRAGDTWVRIEA